MAISDKFGDAVDKAKEKIADKDERDQRIDQAGDAIDAKTDGKFADKVDRAQDAAHKGGDQITQERSGQNRNGQNRNNNSQNRGGSRNNNRNR
ncbi:hypothetical protein Ais01nite_82480 [Asanoa ishikariensis]|uniref:MT0933-like antitoxin protein n=1 Tax=Asanoa ishikariensis TaxID=137265 RepID=A0A1H3SAT1_9ACTN|nr:antitoxin [Asanoa ishikariensis]GIF70213.1 hypothetical protein Ais01nite_82480 [Asanoa ishikariensis]SDZ35203.1 MT0933-like antitoxin protein [Asanoa ishikariensis]